MAKPLDSAQHSHYKLVVKASDEGDPPRSDTAEVNIIVGSGQGVRLFPLRMYEVLVFENQLAPQVILDLNATDEIAHRAVEYQIVGNKYNGLFSIEPESGRLSVTSSLDRETKARYLIKVKVSSGKRASKSLGKRSIRERKDKKEEDFDVMQHIAFDETVVSIKVGDENDNSPVFEHGGKPIVAAVPLEASFGYQVAKVQV